MTYITALKKIQACRRTEGIATVERMRLICKYLGEPQKGLKFIHITGTNGKGSCASMLDSVLREAGYITGRFVSPYINDFRERITVDGEMIPEEELVLLTEMVFSAIDEMNADIERARRGEDTRFPISESVLTGDASSSPVQFEVVSAIGFLYFKRRMCDVVVLECGLGGKYDATNIIDPPLAVIVTPVDLDHTELLGGTEEKIAGEKSGVIKRGTGVTVSSPQYPRVYGVLSNVCSAAKCRLASPIKADLTIDTSTLMGLGFTYRGKQYATRMPALYQATNAITVIEAVIELVKLGMEIPDEAVVRGIYSAYMPARFEVVSVSPTFIVDGAHNENGIGALMRSLRQLGDKFTGKINFAIGILRDKNPKGALLPFADFIKEGDFTLGEIVAVTPSCERAMPSFELAEILKEILPEGIEISTVDNLDSCGADELKGCFSSIGKDDALISFGSLYLASDMRILMKDFLGGNSIFNERM